MKILILGASSYVGARLYLDLSRRHEVVGTYATHKLAQNFIHLDITDPSAVVAAVANIRPHVIVHAANNANAGWCEAHPAEAQTLNVDNTNHVVAAAGQVGARLIYISSFAAGQPTNVYAKTKRDAETIVAASEGEWLILRPSLVVGLSPNTTGDRPFNRFLKNLDSGTPAKYSDQWKFQPTWAGHLSEVIEQSIVLGLNRHTIPVAVPELKTRYDLAKDILGPFGVTVNTDPEAKIQPDSSEDLSILTTLGLPSHTYAQIIEAIVSELNHRQNFQIKP